MIFKGRNIALGLVLFSFAFFTKCTNDDSLLMPGGGIYYNSLAQVHDSLAKDITQFQILDNSVDTTLVGPEGTKLYFPANSLSTTAAPYEVSLIEIYRRGEMIAHNIQTFADDEALVSGGMFWLSVKDANGAEQNLSGVQAILPRKTDAAGYENSMQYFIGQNQNAPSGPVISWGLSQAEVGFDPNAGTNGEYTIYNILGGWSNCDAFYQFISDGATQFKVKVTNDTSNYTDTKVFFTLNNTTTVAALTLVEDGALATYPESIPTGASGTIIAISLKGGKLHFASKNVTIVGNEIIDLEVHEGSLESLQSMLSSID